MINNDIKLSIYQIKGENSMENTLYERLGGEIGIRKLANDIAENHLWSHRYEEMQKFINQKLKNE